MKGDFSRLTFDPTKQFTQVFLQQGRVQLDADWNEQAAILRHYLERLAADLIGPYGGPADDLGFSIEKADKNSPPADLKIGQGRYYVDGLRVGNLPDVTYSKQPNLPQADKLPAFPFLVYLDVWERHVTYVEDESIREVALEGPDTATRAQVVWQVKVTNQLPTSPAKFPTNRAEVEQLWPAWVEAWQSAHRGSLKARAKPTGDVTDPCVASPDARFRGLENQLYRVEVHTGGTAGTATFKWSRDNGSVAFAIVEIKTDKKTDSKTSTTTVTLDHLGHEGRSALAAGDWVEVVDDTVLLTKGAGTLLQVATVDADCARVTLSGTPDFKAGEGPHPLLRRWDHRQPKDPKPDDGALLIQEKAKTTDEDLWLDLEDGVQIAFQPVPPAAAATQGVSLDSQSTAATAKQVASTPVRHTYRTGDYWLIPARTATGDVEWPQTTDAQQNQVPKALPPHGVQHRFAPLGLLVDGTVQDLRKSFKGLAQPVT